MPKRHKKNFFVIITALIIGATVYFVFMSEKAIAPDPDINFTIPTTASIESTGYQDSSKEQINASVLMYHHIGALPENADNIRKGLTVSSEEFASQLQYLSENNYQIITLGQLEKAIIQKRVPEKVVVLTFDDGYSDNFSEALPILKKYKAVGTFFIITSKMDSSEYLTKDQVKELAKAGNEIGSHSLTHLTLSKLRGAALEKEVKQSKSDLETLLGSPVISFCYPAGKYNEETTKAVSDAGYKIAVTTHASTGTITTNQLLEIYRYRISSSMSFPALFR